MRAKGFLKFLLIFTAVAVVLVAVTVGLYLKVLPWAISEPKTLTGIENILSKMLDAEVKIIEPSLKTEWSPNVYLKAKSFTIGKNGEKLLELKNPDTEISFANILSKNIIIKKINTDYLNANLSSILELSPFKQQNQTQENGWSADIFKSEMNVSRAQVFYQIDKENSVKINAQGVKISDDEVKKTVSYDINLNLCRDKKFCLDVSTRETGNNTYILDKEKLIIENSNLKVDKSDVLFNGNVDFKGNYNLNFKGNNFTVKNLMEILDTQVVANNLEDYFVYFKDIDGNFNFNIDANNSDIKGDIKLNKLTFKLIPLANIPVELTQGNVKFDNDKITLKNFKGHYNYQKSNEMDFEGNVTDYLNSVDTDLVGNAVVTNDFAKNYLSKLISYPVGIDGRADTRVMIKSKNNRMDITWLYKFEKGTGFIFDGSESDINKIAHRVFVAKMHFENMLLNIKSLDYHFVNPDWKRDNKREPIISMKGNIDFKNGEQFIKDFGITLTKPMPSVFVNLLIKQNLFKGGTFTGHMDYINTGKYPVLSGNLKAQDVRIPSQRLLIKNGEFKTDKEHMHIDVNGILKRTKYDINGVLENKLAFPIVVKDANLTVDNVDIERHLKAFNEQGANNKISTEIKDELMDENDESATFDLANLIIEKCKLTIEKGNYRGINFSNVVGNLTLDKNSLLTLKSNRFEIAEGNAEANSICDLKNHKYNLSLAVMGVNSDIIATELVNLPKEINGKASGLMELNTDESLLLNGTIKFVIQNGIIAKMGLVEYTMKVAALFRNPIVMITPAVISDLIEVPEGKFERINGSLTLERNVIRKMVIKSVSPQLSTYITGRYNLHNQDAILRIYTRFSNKGRGALGFLRNISLNSLANRIPLSSRNNSNYYAAEISELPKIEASDKDTQIFLTTVDGDIVTNNFLSSLKKIK